jgi:hypothetical protein
MSIKSFHILFIALSIITSFWVAIWGFDQALLLSIASLLVGIALVVYGFHVIKKFKTIS